MAQLRLCFLGRIEAVLGGIPLTGFESNKVRALLACLAVESGRPQRREALAALLWPDWPQQSAMSNLRYALADLRKNIRDRDAKPPFLLITRESIQFNPEAEVWVDVGEFERSAISSQPTELSGQLSAVDGLRSAVDLYRGEFLAGFSVADSPAFDQWVLARRQAYQRLALQALFNLAEAYRQQDDLDSALPYAYRQLELEPWLEEGHQQVMQLLALSGQRSQALAQYEACRKALLDELGVEPSQETKWLYDAIRNEDLQGIKEWGTQVAPAPYPAAPVVLPPEPGEPPFKGLQYFDVPDADLFFGREALTARLVGHIRRMVEAASDDPEGCCFLAVVGASGSGKSSVVRAGVVPALQRGVPLADGTLPPEGSPGWQMHVFTPTAHPLEALAVSLTREAETLTAAAQLMDDFASDGRSLQIYAQRMFSPASPGLAGKCRLLLVVDQFEELFTLCRSEAERSAFLDNLLNAVRGGGVTQVMVVLRADFYSHCAQYPRLRQALCTRQEYIGPMDAAELRRAIEEPAERNNWEFEAGLVEVILRDTGEEPGALPLLEHALLETWRRRSGRRLTLKGYTEAGGVHGSIAKTAESIFSGLDARQQALARLIFLRLTELGEGTQDTRRRAPLSELSPASEDAAQVAELLKALADARLITLSEDTAEVAHEALIREWPALRTWLSEDREGLRLHRHLTESAEAWEELDRDPGELYRGARLAQAVEWAQEHPDELNTLEQEYLQVSQQRAEAEAAEREAQRQRELEAARRLARSQRQRSLVLGVGLVIAVILIGVALWLYRAANTNLGMAQDAQQTAQAEAFSRATQEQRALQEADQRATQEAIAVEQARLADEQAQLSRSRELAAAAVSNLEQDPQLSLLLALEAYHTAGTGEAESALHQAVQASHLEKILASDPAVMGSSGALTSLAYSPDGSRLAVVNDQDRLQVFDTLEGNLVFTYTLDESLQALENIDTNYRPGMGVAVEYFPDGRLCLEGSNWFVILDGEAGQELLRGTADQKIVQVVDRLTGRELFHFEHQVEYNFPIYAEYTPAGINIIVYSENEGHTVGELTAYNLLTGQTVITRRWQRGGETFYVLNQIEYSSDGSRIALSQGEVFEVWDLRTQQLVARLAGVPTGFISEVAFSPDGSLLAVRDAENSLKVWQIDSGDEILYTTGMDFTFSPDGQRLIVTDANRRVAVWSLATRRALYQFLCNPLQTDSALRPDGKQIAAGGEDGAVYLCEVSPDYELHAWVSDDLVLNYAYAPGPALLGIASADNAIRLYDVETGALFSIMEMTPNTKLYQFDISQDGARIAAMNENYTIKTDPVFIYHIWETATGREVLREFPYNQRTWIFLLSPDGNQTLEFLDGYWVSEFSNYDVSWTSNALWQDGVWFVAMGYSPDGSRLGLAKTDGRVSVLDMATDTQEMTSTLASEPTVLTFHPDGSRLAVATQKGEVFILDARTGETALSLPGQATAVRALAYSPDGQLLATGAADGSVSLWDSGTGEKKLDLIRHASAVNFLAFHANGKWLASGSQDGVARLSAIPVEEILSLARQKVRRQFSLAELRRYNIGAPASTQTGIIETAPVELAAREIILPAIPPPSLPLPQPPRQPGAPISLANVAQMTELGWGYIGNNEAKAISPDGKYIATVDALTLSLYELKTMQFIWRRQIDYYVDRNITFSPDGSLIAAGGDDSNVHVLRAQDGAEVLTLAGHTLEVMDVKFSPDGKLLASCSADDLVLLWRMPDGELVEKLTNDPYAKGVWAIDFSPDGALLASGAIDGKVRIWDVQRQALIREFPIGSWGALSVEFSPDGADLLVLDGSWTIGTHTWQVADGAALVRVEGWFWPPLYSPDGSLIVSYFFHTDDQSHRDLGDIYVTNAQDGTLVASFKDQLYYVNRGMFTPDSLYYLFVTMDGILHIWGVP